MCVRLACRIVCIIYFNNDGLFNQNNACIIICTIYYNYDAGIIVCITYNLRTMLKTCYRGIPGVFLYCQYVTMKRYIKA